jgi:glycerophosphoryl diester phosphodiesterase
MNGFFKPTKNPKVLGHRDAPIHYQENTLQGFRKAQNLGAHGVELDVFMTRDKKLVIFHDEDTYRLTGVKGSITEMTWDEVSRLRIQKNIDRGDGTLISYKSEQHIPLLEEVLYELPADFLINIDWIETDHLDRLLEILELSGHNDTQPSNYLHDVV